MNRSRNNNNNRGQRKNRQQRRGVPRAPRNLELQELGKLSASRTPIHRFSRTTAFAYAVTPTTGWNASSNFDLGLTFSLASTFVYLAGTLNSTQSNPGSGDFTALYDRYRLESVEVSLMGGTNMYPAATGAAAQLPIMNIVFDPSDISTFSLSSILQYQNLHTVQLGNQRTQNGYVIKFKPRPLLTAGGSAVAASELNPWISKDVPSTPYYGLKIFYDAAGSALATQISAVSFYVKYNWAFTSSQ